MKAAQTRKIEIIDLLIVPQGIEISIAWRTEKKLNSSNRTTRN